jgi:hypothetical protein
MAHGGACGWRAHRISLQNVTKYHLLISISFTTANKAEGDTLVFAIFHPIHTLPPLHFLEFST